MNLYLSRLLLDMRSRQVMAEVAHPYEMHRTLMRAFPQATEKEASGARDEFGVLFRPEVDERRGVVKVYVQSGVEPDWRFLDGLRRYLLAYGTTPAYECQGVIRAFQAIREGQVLAFRLRANPTKRVARDGDPLRGKRVELQTEDDQIAWLARKGRGGPERDHSGFVLLETSGRDESGQEVLIPRVQARCEGKLTGWKKDSTAGHKTTHLSVVFDGLLRVTDTDAFLDTLRRGIGPGKAYGFGLLSVARPSDLTSGKLS